MIKYFAFAAFTLLAGLLQGVTGFGAGIAMMSVLPSMFPLNRATGVSCATTIVLAAMMVRRYGKHIKLKTVLWPALLYTATASTCILLSKRGNQETAKHIFGVFLIVLGIYYLFFNKKTARKYPLAVSILFVVISGCCNGFFGVGGPLMVLYYLGQTDSKEEYLGSIQLTFLVNLLYGTALRVSNGILTVIHLPYIGIGAVCVLVGLAVANRVVDKLNAEKPKKLIYCIIILSGLVNLFG